MLKSFLATIITLCSIVFVISQQSGFWDRYFGLDEVEKIAANFEQSYAPGASKAVHPGDPGWQPLLRLINNFSTANLPKDKEPKVFARLKAISSHGEILGNGDIVEWTAPTTPVYLLYKEWPGQEVQPEYYRKVGTIADLRSWLTKYRDEFKYTVQGIGFPIATVLATAITGIIALIKKRNKQSSLEPFSNLPTTPEKISSPTIKEVTKPKRLNGKGKSKKKKRNHRK